VIDVFVWKEPDLTTTVVVRPDGRISLPLTNEIEASGKTVVQLWQEITEKLREYIAQPVVSVIVKQVNSLKISVWVKSASLTFTESKIVLPSSTRLRWRVVLATY